MLRRSIWYWTRDDGTLSPYSQIDDDIIDAFVTDIEKKYVFPSYLPEDFIEGNITLARRRWQHMYIKLG